MVRAYLLCIAGACLAAAQSQAVFEKVRAFTQEQGRQKQIPVIAVALLNDEKILWQFATGDAAPDAVYRVGSVSKLFTDVAVMQLASQGRLDIDAAVGRYLPEFNKAVTLRQLMSHRAGLVREPPVGHYFDDAPRTLEETVGSLNQTALVYEPGTRTKYSNAGIAVVGRVVEALAKKPFADAVRESVLDPLGMKSSAFLLKPEMTASLAKAFLWTYDGRTFPAPQFELGMSPAGSLYTSLPDLSRFASAILRGGNPILSKEALARMTEPQFGGRYGIGFALGKLDNENTLSHGGAIYGFATDLTVIPSQKLGVIVVCNMDSANSVASRIARQALRWAMEERRGEPLREVRRTAPLTSAEARSLAGRYGEAADAFELTAREEKLFLAPVRGGRRWEVRRSGDALITDDRHGFGRVVPAALKSKPVPKPAAVKQEWRSLIGEYGWDHNVLYVLEHEGELSVLIEWYDYYPLTPVGPNTFRFPDSGLYEHESLTFTSAGAMVGGVLFPKRPQAEGSVFRVIPRRPVPDLRKTALASSPPEETGPFRRNELKELRLLDKTIRLDIRYASKANFLGTPVYSQGRAFLQRPAAEALARAHKELVTHGYGLLIHDAYRPWYVSKIFWDATSGEQHDFVADPSKGSRHNRGCAVDLTLYELATGKPVEMPGLYDEMTARSYPDYPGSTSLARWHRELLRNAMEQQGFRVYDTEWWHFDYKDWSQYGIQNVTFEKLKGN